MTPAPAEHSPPDSIMPEQSAPSKQLTLNILQYITSSQAAHGLRHGDYLRYRRYCTRRLSRIRRSTGTTNAARGSSNRYQHCELTAEIVTADARVLPIALVCAERDWAFARDVKREKPAGEHRARRVALAKLSRALANAEQLCALCRLVADEHTVLEAEAYAASMRAELALEKKLWAPALSAYQIVHKIYAGMAGVNSGTSVAALYERKVEDVENAMRLCRYHLSRTEGAEPLHDDVLRGLRSDTGAGTTDVLSEMIESALVEARRRAAVSFGEIVWCGITVPLRAERVKEAVLAAQEESADFVSSKTVVDAYDRLFIVYNDAVKVVSAELGEFEASTASRAEDRIKELQYIIAYLTYNRLQHTVARNLALVESFKQKRASKPEDFVRLYDNLISNMTDMLGLSGVEDDAAVFNECTSRQRLFQAHRCFHLAQCYQAVGLQSEAAALFDRVGTHAGKLSGEHAEEARKIVDESTGMKCRAKAEAFLSGQKLANGLSGLHVSEHKFVTKSLMVDNLDKYESFVGEGAEECAIAQMPPALEAVPCKPVLFDLAKDGIRFVESKKEADVAEETKKTAAQSSSVFSSSLGRWWSGKS